VAKRPAKNDREQNLIDLDLWAENQKGETVVTGKATAVLITRRA